MPCSTCQGTGQVIKKPCPRCKGQGIVEERREIVVRVPAGVDTGTRLRVRGEGEPGEHGGPQATCMWSCMWSPAKNTNARARTSSIPARSASCRRPSATVWTCPASGPAAPGHPKGHPERHPAAPQGEGMPYPGRSNRGDLLVEVKVLAPHPHLGQAGRAAA